MNVKFTLIPFIALAAISCGQSTNESEQTSDSPKYDCIMPPPDSIHGQATSRDTIKECYRYDKGQQHNWIEITRSKDSAWGTLHYTFEEKDGRNGPFTGHFNGDTLWIIYDGMIEGSVETSEVGFLAKGNKLHEAQGTVHLLNGVYRYKYKSMLVFDDPTAMAKGPCMQ
jgi:hypothetical protein